MSDTTQTLSRAVVARFDGRSVRFELPLDHHSRASLEAAIGSPIAAFNRFVEASWTLNDVWMVLAHAYPGARLMHGLTRVEAVEAAMLARPVGRYSPLASKILRGLLFGLAPDEATFSDEAD